MEVQNKVIIVTGAGSGMGRELALQLLAKNAKVIAVDIHEAGLLETVQLADDYKAAITYHVADITSRTAIEELRDKILPQFGGVDGIINNAGIIQPFVKVNDLGFDSIERVMNVNFYGTVYMTKTFLPHLLTRPEAHIVNISSMGGFLPVPGQSVYGASKAAVKLFTEGLHSELANTRVKVTVVFPGAVNTNITVNSGLSAPTGNAGGGKQMKILSPVDAARLMIQGMEKNSYRVVVGKDAWFLDLLYRLNPAYAARFINKKMQALLAK